MPSGGLANASAEQLSPEPPSLQQQSKTCPHCHAPLTAPAADSPSAAVPPQNIADSSDPASFCLRCRDPPQRGFANGAAFAGAAVASVPTARSIQPHAPRERSSEVTRYILPRSESKGKLIDERPVLTSLTMGVNETPHRHLLHTITATAAAPSINHFRPPPAAPIEITSTKSRSISAVNRRDPTLIPSLVSSISPRFNSPASPCPISYRNNSFQRDSDDDYPDPLADVTRLRVRSKGYKCLHPGAIFQGTQKSGRTSYEVQVTIVDVDFGSSFLCGYLRIRGLTEDWPELTTYFDAQIIGSRYGFLTQDWGASKEEDKIHWSRFPAYRAVKDELKEPRMTLKNNDKRSAVFMRWKERFLVPDHRVQDISGASFAGFYYVCVDFEPQNSPAPVLSREEAETEQDSVISDGFPKVIAEEDEMPVETERHRKSPGRPTRSRGPQPATMCGFYYHQNSEPYQQLSLTHVESHYTSSFEFR